MLNARAINNDGQTALHTLCLSVNKDSVEDELLTAAAWLISMGCPLDVKWNGKTADVIAEENGRAALCGYLRKELRLGQTPGMSSRPVFFKGYTYLSLRFLSQTLEKGMKPDFSTMSAVFLLVDVASNSGTVLEPAQRITEGHYKAANGIKMWWGAEHFLQNPIENLHDMAKISISLFSVEHGKIAETHISLKRSSIDSGCIVIDLKTQSTQPRTHSTLLVDLSLQSLL